MTTVTPAILEGATLTSGRYSATVTDSGAGWSEFGELALTRWSGDMTTETEGFFLYIRDLDSGAVWSASQQPTGALPHRYSVHRRAAAIEIEREDEEIAVKTLITLAASGDAEQREFTFTNRSARHRRLELTTYAEVVLNTLTADASHPAFSKLFVQTELDVESSALLAHRRPRAPDEVTSWLAHAFTADQQESLGWETDRARFIGRGRSLRNPRALDANVPLSGTVGNVLDPIVSIRCSIELAPGETARATAVLGVASDREGALEIARRLGSAMPRGRAIHREDTGDRTTKFAVDGVTDREGLQCFNGYGGFSVDGREYVIRLSATAAGPRRPPLPWTNVVANEKFGFIVSESGAGYTWSENSRQNRLTTWYNDPVVDPHGEALYIRDRETDIRWSPTPGPLSGGGDYETRHGFGYTLFRHTSQGIEQEVLQFVPRSDALKVVRLRLRNRSTSHRRLSAYAFFELVLGELRSRSARDIVTSLEEVTGAIVATNDHNGEFAGRIVYAAPALQPEGSSVHATSDRVAFLGHLGSPERPAALQRSRPLDGRTGAGLDACAALQVDFELSPEASTEIVFLLGEAADVEAARGAISRFSSSAAVTAALDDVRAFWNEATTAVTIATPAPAIDLMINGWLVYQNLSCRMWGRSAFYQSGGALGYRDQLQDSSALLYVDPAITRRQIVLHAAHQFPEGDVLHWWHPPTRKGIRTRFSDDLLWLPYITSFYIRATGDWSVLDEIAGYVDGPALESGEDEAFLFPVSSAERSSVFEHCARAIDRSLTKGAHGLPLIGVGDWNDGMNRVGRQGRGESVWLGFFLHSILEALIPIADRRGETERATAWRIYQRELGNALDLGGWDGAWYRRAYYDDGTPIGSATSDECRIDAIAQAWAVLSSVASPERVSMALDALETHLVDEEHGLIRLLTPPFDRTPYDPGYIKGYLPGVRENGGQYTHGALWAVSAMARAGRGERAATLLEMLSPVAHTRTAEAVDRYRAEPYVIAADVYGVDPHVGRAGWTWYTGSAGWYYRVTIESVLGLELVEGKSLSIRPNIPRAWPGFSAKLRLLDRKTVYEIEVRRVEGATVTSALVDGRPLSAGGRGLLVPLTLDGGLHRVVVSLSDAS